MRALLLASVLFVGSFVGAQAQEALYGPQPPKGSAYVRVVSALDAKADVKPDFRAALSLGTGSTDLLIGGYRRGTLAAAPNWGWFVQGNLDQPVLISDGYRPGLELDAAAGFHYDGWTAGGVLVSPIAQVIGSDRARDSGPNSADPVASGYQRLFLSPGIELNLHPVRVYADVEFPVYQHMTGNQLVAPVLVKVSASYHF